MASVFYSNKTENDNVDQISVSTKLTYHHFLTKIENV